MRTRSTTPLKRALHEGTADGVDAMYRQPLRQFGGGPIQPRPQTQQLKVQPQVAMVAGLQQERALSSRQQTQDIILQAVSSDLVKHGAGEGRGRWPSSSPGSSRRS